MTILQLQADAGRRSHASVRVLLFGAFFYEQSSLSGRTKKKDFQHFRGAIRTRTHTSMHVYMHVSGCLSPHICTCTRGAPAGLSRRNSTTFDLCCLCHAAVLQSSSWLPRALTPLCSWSTQSGAGKAQSVSPNTAQAVRLTALFPLIQAAPLTHTLSLQHLRWIGMIYLQSLMIMYSTLAVKLFRPALLLSP